MKNALVKAVAAVPAKMKIVTPVWADIIGKSGEPLETMKTTRQALAAFEGAGIVCSYDIFHDRRLIGGEILGSEHGQISDDVCLKLREMIRDQFNFDPGKNNMWDAINLACRENAYHPILDYLKALTWDGKHRIDTWLIDYMNAPNTPFVRAVSAMTLTASVRRVRKPGTKFDYMTVLESPEGENKSSALAALYGAENFSDQSILGLTDKELQEAVRGRWGMEAADLSGMRRADVERLKAQLSRQEDRTRPAYGRAVIDTPRCGVFWGTTNDAQYLRSQTGNRRFLPVPVARIDVKRIIADRDQLWAEACVADDLEMDIMLPEALWAAAAVEQDARTERDPWLDLLRDVARHGAREKDRGAYEVLDTGEERISSMFILRDVIMIESRNLTPEHGKRLSRVLGRLGWNGPKPMRINGKTERGYWRVTPDPLS